MSGSVIPCVGAVVTDGRGRLLMIKRGHEPGAGLWSIPGGRIEPGETDAEALVREMFEETGLAVEVGRLIGRVQRPGPNGAVIDISGLRGHGDRRHAAAGRRRRGRALGGCRGPGFPGDYRRPDRSPYRLGCSGAVTAINVRFFWFLPWSDYLLLIAFTAPFDRSGNVAPGTGNACPVGTKVGWSGRWRRRPGSLRGSATTRRVTYTGVDRRRAAGQLGEQSGRQRQAACLPVLMPARSVDSA